MAKPGYGSCRVAYLVNQYPAPSHTFIRAEVRSLEDLGWRVYRYSHRKSFSALVDDLDLEESRNTRVLLGGGLSPLLMSILRCVIHGPRRFFSTFFLALSLAGSGDRRFIAHIGYFGIACLLSDQLRTLGFPHLHAHFGTNPAAVALLTNRMCDVTYSFTLHSSYEYKDPEKLNLRQKVASATFVVVISRHAYEAVVSRCPESAQNVRLIRSGLEEQWFKEVPTRIPNSRQLLCVSRLAEHKDIPSLLEAACILRDRGVLFRLKIVGDGNLRGDIERMIGERGLAECVTLVGLCSRSEIIEHLKQSIALVLSSQDEGIPVAIMESFAMGRPAIATDVGGVRELVETNKTGWLVPANNPSVLAEALSSCLNADRGALQVLATEARKRVSRYVIESSARALAKEFRQSKNK